MEIFTSSSEIKSHLEGLREQGNTIGFVPTMGALHDGHLGLIQQAKEEVDCVVCSIFVNPLQFNRKEDLEKYPDRISSDQSMLEDVECDFLFLPAYSEVYPEDPNLEFDFGTIGKGMEAEYRPNHFEGVAAVIARFFDILNPTKAYFGEKDYQQLAIVRWLAKNRSYETEVVGCPTVRFENGLAMSSRNYLLTDEEREMASLIYQTLLYCKVNVDYYDPEELAQRCYLKLLKHFTPEYFVIADEDSMEPLKEWTDSKRPRAFVAAYLSSVRLIDNLSLNP